ncbi:MAG: hypothetical protein ACYC8V_15135 [Caulobacteraceae bacterium]
MVMVIAPAKALNLAPVPARAALTPPQLKKDIAALSAVTAKFASVD